MQRFESVWVTYMLGVMAYCFYACFTETGPVGWINLAQQWIFGAYYVKASFLVSIIGLLVVGALIRAPLERVFGAEAPASSGPDALAAAPIRSTARPASLSRRLLHASVATVASIWVVGFAVCIWLSHQQQSDNTAVYQPLVLSEGATVSPSEGDHLAVQGEVLASRVVVHRTSSESSAPDHEDYYLVPLVSPGWSPGEPTALVLKIDKLSQLPGFNAGPRRQAWALPQALLVRVGGAVSVPAAHEFSKMGVPLAETSHLLYVVPSRDGKPLLQDTDHLQITLWVCSALSGVLLLILGLAGWREHRRVSPALRSVS